MPSSEKFTTPDNIANDISSTSGTSEAYDYSNDTLKEDMIFESSSNQGPKHSKEELIRNNYKPVFNSTSFDKIGGVVLQHRQQPDRYRARAV